MMIDREMNEWRTNISQNPRRLLRCSAARIRTNVGCFTGVNSFNERLCVGFCLRSHLPFKRIVCIVIRRVFRGC